MLPPAALPAVVEGWQALLPCTCHPPCSSISRALLSMLFGIEALSRHSSRH